MYWRPKPSYMRVLPQAEAGSEGDITTMGVNRTRKMGSKIIEAKGGRRFCRGLWILPKIVSVSFLAHLNICGQIFNVVSECKYKMKQTQKETSDVRKKSTWIGKTGEFKSFFTTAKKEKVSKDQDMDYLLFAVHRVKEFIPHFSFFVTRMLWGRNYESVF